jgi:hypothetical protein
MSTQESQSGNPKTQENQPACERRFFDKNIGPVDRMIRAIVGILFMAAGLLGFDAQKINSGAVGLILVLIGFLIFIQAPMGWCPVCAIKRRSTYEKED